MNKRKGTRPTDETRKKMKASRNKWLREQRGANNPHWKGGRYIKEGYVMVRLEPEDPFYLMQGSDGYTREHRLVMARHLGRPLYTWEVIHHINGIKDDNRIGNLQLFNDNGHSSIPQVCNLRRRIAYLEKLLDENGIEYKLLHWANRS